MIKKANRCLFEKSVAVRRICVKKIWFICILCIAFCLPFPLFSQNVSLDDAIIAAGQSVGKNLKAGTKVAVLNFSSDTPAFSSYVIEELMDYLTNQAGMVVVERSNLNKVREEMHLQLSGDISDESAQAIGHMLGAQSIVSGSLTDTGSVYRFRIYTINVESAARESSISLSVNRNDSQVRFLLTKRTDDSSGVSGPVQNNQGQQQAVTDNQEQQPVRNQGNVTGVYKIGDTGPAGGIIFYDKGAFSNGWRYMEAAPVEIEFQAKWGTNGKGVSTQDVVGSGKRNTQLIVEALKQANETGMAAQYCSAIDFDGYKDWFIPSKDELDLIYKNLKLNNIGGFGSGRYFSSSQRGRVSVWTQNFTGGRQDDFSKNDTYAVRVIRSF